jgi:hypothetical protein
LYYNRRRYHEIVEVRVALARVEGLLLADKKKK